MRLTIDGHDVVPTTTQPREPGFGQAAPGPRVSSYTLEVPTDTFVAALEAFYEDLAEDDARDGAEDAPLDVRTLRALGWPPLARLVAAPPPLFEQLLQRAGHEVLRALPWGPPVPGEWLLDSVDTVRITAGVVRIRGRAVGRV